jgi:hypothetical protein
MAQKIQVRTDTAANWTAANPVLSLGEPALESDTKKIKYGDGITAWNSLNYMQTPFSGAKRSNSIVQNLGQDAYGKVDTNATDYDAGSWWDDVNKRFVVPSGVSFVAVKGYIHVAYSGFWGAKVIILKNGVVQANSGLNSTTGGNAHLYLSVAEDFSVTAGDYFEIYVSHAGYAGATIDNSKFSIAKLG